MPEATRSSIAQRVENLQADLADQTQDYAALTSSGNGASQGLRVALEEQAARLDTLRAGIAELAAIAAAPAAGTSDAADEPAPGAENAATGAGTTATAPERTPPPAVIQVDEPPPAAAAETPTTVGEGVTAYRAADYVRALELWRPLAEAGNARAQFHMGALYFDGHGVMQDASRAYMWLTRAVRGGDSLAPSLLARLQARMTQADLTEAQRLLGE